MRDQKTLLIAMLLAGFLGCSEDTKNGGSGGAGGAGGSTGGSGGRGGSSGTTGGSGASGSGGATGGSGGATGGSGGSTAGAGGGGSGGSTGGTSGAGGTSGSGGSGGSAGSPGDAGDMPRADAAPSEGGAVSCGMVGQACCATNMCLGGATPMTSDGAGGGMTVLELVANGGNPYQQFAAKNLLPIDGPDSGYITDDGNSFLFVLHQNGAEETVSSGAQRQRNEVTVNPGNPAIYKGTRDTTMTYTWRFRLEQMNAGPTWCDIFQIKQHGPLGVAPYMAFEANKSNLEIDTEKAGIVRSIPLSAIMNTWINATVTLKYSDQGSLSILLKKDDGTTVLSYTNNSIDMWDTTVDFVRPKWGLYRNKRDGAGEAAIRYNNMKIIRGGPGTPAGCTCR